MLSRVAETLYWTARYVERAENLARLINVNNTQEIMRAQSETLFQEKCGKR